MIYETSVWTKRGWTDPIDLLIGDVVISYNNRRNCTEYDQISHINIDYGMTPIFGLKSHSLNISVTPDHPMIIRDIRKKTIERKTMNDVFLSILQEHKSVLYSAPFEPYLVSHDLDDIAWSARVASSFGNDRYMPIEYVNDIWSIIENISGIEAQHWIEVFIHWNVLIPRTYWHKAVYLNNRQVTEMVLHVVPRAGFGTRIAKHLKRSGRWVMGLSIQNTPQIRKTNWYRDRVEGYTFNVKTKNGNFLAKKSLGTFLCPCDIT